jgi:hypothetical protein
LSSQNIPEWKMLIDDNTQYVTSHQSHPASVN